VATKTSELLAALEIAASRARAAIRELENNHPAAAKREIQLATATLRSAVDEVSA